MNNRMSLITTIFDHARYAANRTAALKKAYQSPNSVPSYIKALRQEKVKADDKVNEAIESAIRNGGLSFTDARMAAQLGHDSPLPYRPRDYFAKAEKQTKRKPHYKLSSKPIRAGRYVVITRGLRAGQIHKVTSVRTNSFSSVYITPQGKPDICCFPHSKAIPSALPVQTKLWQEPTWHIM